MKTENLSQKEKDELFKKLSAEREAKQKAEDKKKADYSKGVEKFVQREFTRCRKISEQLQANKKQIFESADALIALKNELYKVKSDRQSDTFTSDDGRISIKLGNRILEGWDDLVDVGIEKVKQYLHSLSKDENSAMLVDTVMGLLAKDRKGTLKAGKVLELEKLAAKANDPLFLEGIKIIKEAYRPVPSCQFIEVTYKDENGKEQSLPLSMSTVSID